MMRTSPPLAILSLSACPRLRPRLFIILFNSYSQATCRGIVTAGSAKYKSIPLNPASSRALAEPVINRQGGSSAERINGAQEQRRGVNHMLEQVSGVVTARPSRGRWYVLLMISAMYLITYLDRVTAHQQGIRLRQGDDGLDFFRLRLGLCNLPGSRRLAVRQIGRARRSDWDRHLLVAHDGGHRRRIQCGFVHRRALSVRGRRSRRISGRDARHATLVSAVGTRLRAGYHP